MDAYSDLIHKKKLHRSWFWKRFSSRLLQHNAAIRTRYASFFEKHIPTPHSGYQRILDIGSGSGFYLPLLCDYADTVFALEIEHDLCASARHTVADGRPGAVNLVTGSMASLPFHDESFGLVMFLESLHHILQPGAAIKEAARVLKKDGRILLLEPNGANPLNFLISLFSTREKGMMNIRHQKLTALFPDFYDLKMLPSNSVFCSGAFLKTVAKLLDVLLFTAALKKFSIRYIITARKK